MDGCSDFFSVCLCVHVCVCVCVWRGSATCNVAWTLILLVHVHEEVYFETEGVGPPCKLKVSVLIYF